jgi:hypothetical protein
LRIILPGDSALLLQLPLLGSGRPFFLGLLLAPDYAQPISGLFFTVQGLILRIWRLIMLSLFRV